MYKYVLQNINEGILELTLNRPDSLNAFTTEMLAELKHAMQSAKNDDAIKIILLSGSGKAFCAGGDVKAMGERTPLFSYDHIGNLQDLVLTMRELDKPIIAAVHGYAAGAGVSIALAADIVFAKINSKFILSFSKVGLVSDGGALYFLPKLIGLHRAKELFFNAEPIDAEKAYHMGIINNVYKDFDNEVRSYAIKLATGPIRSYGFIKKIANQSLNSTLENVLEFERMAQATMVSSPDHLEGVQAFKEKRKPIFNQR